MSKSKTHTVKFGRKRNGKTDYRKRIKYLSSNKIRIVIRPSNNKIIIQAIEFNENGDKCLLSVDSTSLRKYGWKGSTGNISAAYLTGILFGNTIKEKVKEGIVDFGLHSVTKGTRLPATIKGLIDSGLGVPCSKDIFPNDDVISGKLLSVYSSELKKTSPEKYEKQFSKYLKIGLNPEDLPKNFEEVKTKLMGSNEKTK
jgi:large subunit ribosomal protein L18